MKVVDPSAKIGAQAQFCPFEVDTGQVVLDSEFLRIVKLEAQPSLHPRGRPRLAWSRNAEAGHILALSTPLGARFVFAELEPMQFDDAANGVDDAAKLLGV